MPSKPRKPATPNAHEPRLSRGRARDGAIFPVAPLASSLPDGYTATLQEITSHLQHARVRAILAANPIVIDAYWHTGQIILSRQQDAAWGAKVIDRLATDLRAAFPDMSGLSSRNLLSMKLFAEAFPGGSIAKQPVSQLPWGQIVRLLQMVKDPAVRDFYVRETLAQGRSRSILELQIQSQLHLRAGKAQNNFPRTMPPADSDMATQLFKDPYLFDFLGTADPRREVIELKARAFTPGDVGQLNLYLSAVDDLLRHADDQPTIGLLLCRKNNKLVAEYALRGLDQSIAVAAWQTQLTESLPEELRGSLPSVEEIEAELANDFPPAEQGEGGQS